VLTIDDILEATIPSSGVAGAVRPGEQGSAGLDEVEHGGCPALPGHAVRARITEKCATIEPGIRWTSAVQTTRTPTKADSEPKNDSDPKNVHRRPQQRSPHCDCDPGHRDPERRTEGDAMSRRGAKHKDSLPALPHGGLRVVPLGGIGEIGRNMTVFEHAGRLLVVDCGVLFPEEHQPGVDVILPDFSWIRDRLDLVDAIVLTHGHEDHIGGVPYLLNERPDIPLVGSKLTLAFIKAKLKEHHITPKTVEVREGQRQKFGPFDCEFIAVNHSIPDGLAVAIRTAAGLVLHTGDFKMDQFPLDGRLTDLGSFARLAAEGVDLFMVDSTNAEVPGFITSERELSPAIETVFRTCPGRVIVSSFASHVHRIQQVLDAAHEHHRKVAFVGRSMVRNMGIARDLGYLNIPKGLVVDLKALDNLPANKVCLVCTGSQGEPMAALSRMANRDHPIRITQGDTVLLASSLIPGNENAIYGVINELTRWGANVIHKGNAKVHVSGHASAGELAYCYNIVKPANVLPVHGEWRHLRANADLAIRTGVHPERVIIAEDGSVIDLVKGRATITGTVPARLVYVDGMTVGGATEQSLKVRRNMAEEGVVTIVAIVNPDTGKMVEKPDFLAHGFEQDASTFDAAIPVIQRVLTKASKEDIDIEKTEELVSQAVATWAHRTYRRSPLIIPVIIDA
jgi:ribonuclease J